MDEALLQAYLHSDYRVRRPTGGYVCIRIGQTPPRALQTWLGADRPWLFITAWNPHSVRRAARCNRRAQHALLEALRQAGACRILPGVGVGEDGWRESSLLVSGLPFATHPALMRRFGQYAVVRGHGHAAAELYTGD